MSHVVTMFQALKYIDYEDVVALEGHVKSTIQDIEAIAPPLQDGNVIKMSFVETRIELEDSLWQIFSEPREISLMNVDALSRLELPLPNEPGSPLTFWFDMSKQVQKESRQVTSFPSLFGDISGLKDFFNFLIVLAIGGFQTKMYRFSQLRTFFRYSDGNESVRPGESMDVVKSRGRFTKLHLSLLDKLKYSLLYDFCLSRRSVRKKKIFDKANAKLDKALDTRTITHH